MYKVTMNNKKVKNEFATYEAARQYIRKLLRKKLEIRINGQPFDYTSGNGIGGHGYKIVRVA